METNLPPHTGGTPPVIVHAPPPAQPKSNNGWKIFAVILLLLLLGSLALNAISMAGSMLEGGGSATGAQSGQKFEEIVVDNPRARDKVAVLDVKGMISSEPWGGASHRSMADLIEDQLNYAGEDDAVKAVILKVDSPGGEVMASDEIANALRKFQDKHKKPVVASMGSLAASGGYYVSAPCQWIVANDLTITGSIGVILHSFNYRGLMDKVGLRPLVFKSGRFKDMLSGSKRAEDEDPAEREMIQSMIMETYTKFKKVIADGRALAATRNKGDGRPLASNWADLADGRVLTGKQAYDNGFVDELGNFDTAVERTKKIAGITGDARLIRYQEPFNLGSLFSLFGKTETKVKIDVGMEFPKLEAGRMYFLSPTLVQ